MTPRATMRSARSCMVQAARPPGGLPQAKATRSASAFVQLPLCSRPGLVGESGFQALFHQALPQAFDGRGSHLRRGGFSGRQPFPSAWA